MFNKRLTITYAVIYNCAVILDLTLKASAARSTTRCLTSNNAPVDWFIVYTLPRSSSFYYMDANNKIWQSFQLALQGASDPVYNTLAQIYNQRGLTYSMYSDQPPQGTIGAQYGHAKGVVAFDPSTGFWMLHSMPRYPPATSSTYTVHQGLFTNAQVFFCISLETQGNLNKTDAHLTRIRAYSYDCDGGRMSHCNPRRGTSNNILDQHIVSVQQQMFLVFAKPRESFDDIYGDYMVRIFNDDLFVRTWQNGRGTPMSSDADARVFNINTLQFSQGTTDHSKWAITNRQTRWICIGDLNRMVSQATRGGGAICFQDILVWQSFCRLIVDIQDLNDTINCA